MINAKAIGRERTQEERHRRHLYGDKGARFSQRQLRVLGDVMGVVTTFATKDNLIIEIYESNQSAERQD